MPSQADLETGLNAQNWALVVACLDPMYHLRTRRFAKYRFVELDAFRALQTRQESVIAEMYRRRLVWFTRNADGKSTFEVALDLSLYSTACVIARNGWFPKDFDMFRPLATGGALRAIDYSVA